MPDDIQVGDRIEVYSRTSIGRVDYDRITATCDIVGFADKANGIIIVDTPCEGIQLAMWVGSDDGVFCF